MNKARLAMSSLLIGFGAIVVVQLLFMFVPMPDWLADALLVSLVPGLLADFQTGAPSIVRMVVVSTLTWAAIIFVIRLMLMRRRATTHPVERSAQR